MFKLLKLKFCAGLLALIGLVGGAAISQVKPIETRADSSEVVDTITAADLAATGTAYTDFSSVTKSSDAVYAGQSAKNSTGAIQLRSEGSNVGIVSTTSGGILKSITIEVASGTKTIDIYGNNTAYSSATELYQTGDTHNQGTKIGALTATGTITPTDSYAYIGIRSHSGAVYLTSIKITWLTSTPSSSEDPGQSSTDPGDSSDPTPTPIGTENYILIPDGGSNNSYAGNCDIEIDGITWNLTGNSQMQPWRIGGKSLNAVDRELYSKTAMDGRVKSIDLEVGTASSITVNALTLIVAEDAEFTENVNKISASFVAESVIQFKPSIGTVWAAGIYYKFVFNVTVTGTSNKFVEFKGATFNRFNASDFASVFDNSINCDASGHIAPTFIDTSWDDLELLFNELPLASQSILQNANANEDGDAIEQAMARYDYIVGKYGYADFVDRNPTSNTVRGVSTSISSSVFTPALIWVLSTGGIGLATLTLLAIVHRKRYN